MHFRLFGLWLAVLFVPLGLQAQREKLDPEDLAIVEQQWPEAKKTTTGLRYVMLKEGEGPTAKPGDLVSVLYRGAVLNGKVFDEQQDRDRPLTFRLGRAVVIEGWDQGLKLMNKGSKMLLIVPYELGYGTRGDPPRIGRRATLVFEIDMIEIKPGVVDSALAPAPAPKKRK